VSDFKHPYHPEHPERFDDPVSIPVLTDVLVPGRLSTPQGSEGHASAEALPLDGGEAVAAASAETAPADALNEHEEAGVAEDFIEARYTAQLSDAVQGEVAKSIEAVEPIKSIEPIDRIESVQPIELAESEETQPKETHRPTEAMRVDASPQPPALQPATELTERDAEHIADRLCARFAQEGRRVIESRCREALEEHTAWLVRQVTREVSLALEAEVSGWVREAVREELAAHRLTRR
jgi:hypothetical protein